MFKSPFCRSYLTKQVILTKSEIMKNRPQKNWSTKKKNIEWFCLELILLFGPVTLSRYFLVTERHWSWLLTEPAQVLLILPQNAQGCIEKLGKMPVGWVDHPAVWKHGQFDNSKLKIILLNFHWGRVTEAEKHSMGLTVYTEQQWISITILLLGVPFYSWAFNNRHTCFLLHWPYGDCEEVVLSL